MFFVDDIIIVERLKKYPILNHFSMAEIGILVSQSETVNLSKNQILFFRGDPCDAVYFLVEGYLESFYANDFLNRVKSIHNGALIGVTDVLANEPYDAAVKAIRDSRLLKMSHAQFYALFQSKPEFALLLAQNTAKQLRNITLQQEKPQYEYRNIGLITLSANIPIQSILELFQRLSANDNIAVYDEEAFLNSAQDMQSFFYQCEIKEKINVFFSGYNNVEWEDAVIEHTDYFYLITDENNWKSIHQSMISRLKGRPSDIIILHKEPEPYKNTAKFYEKFPFKRHHHIQDTTKDYQRIYRFMTGQAIGLVLSGGGFRAFVHYGLIKALLDSNIPVDYICGSSMGAAAGAILSQHYNWAEFDKVSRHVIGDLNKARAIFNLTLPIVSILSGKVITKLLKKIFSSILIEDLPINYFCVVGNLSENQKQTKHMGKLHEWLRASVAIPGIFPPLEKDGTLYVDGGICSNLPIQDLREKLDGAGTIIAFDIRSPSPHLKKYRFPPILTFRNYILNKLHLSKPTYILPNIGEIVMESFLINQQMYDRKGIHEAEIVITIDSLLPLHKSQINEDILLSAYDVAIKKLNEHRDKLKRWIN